MPGYPLVSTFRDIEMFSKLDSADSREEMASEPKIARLPGRCRMLLFPQVRY